MVESGSARRYLPYALGEIALVVIGILIALQINNWNENRKDRRLEQRYVLQLMSDIQFDLRSYENYMKIGLQQKGDINALLSGFRDDETLSDSSIFQKLNNINVHPFFST